MIRKLDNIAAGIIAGIIVPAIFFYFFVYPSMNRYSFLGESLYKEFVIKMLPMFLSRCIFPNALLFFGLLWVDFAKAAKGVLIFTGTITAILLFINFVL
jgi:hypothetical protein